MTRKRTSSGGSAQQLRKRLHDAEATLKALRTGQVDAIVVAGPNGHETRAFESATHPYHVLLNAMSDGAALLSADGTILFGNRRLAELANMPLERVQGARFPELSAPAERPGLELFVQGRQGGRESTILGQDGSPTPVWIALSVVPLAASLAAHKAAGNGHSVCMAIVTDLTERRHAHATRLGLLQRLLFAEDRERRRIARELHDETGQSLTALLVGLRAIEDKAVTADVQTAARRLRGVAAQTVADIGRLARGLHPSVLDDMGLAVAVQRYVDDYSKSLGIAVVLRADGLVERLAPLVETTMYRILQEALTNVARHAQAHAVNVDLTHDETGLTLAVSDDGVGFDASASAGNMPGLGLHGMRERVALFGGSVEVKSHPGQGTMIRARIPVNHGPH